MPLLDRYIVYGLTDPDGAIRYIGRSQSGLARAREHATRVGRERTHKAAWIRKLLRNGQLYGICTLARCESLTAVIAAEINWIAEGRRLGWRLTNLTSGGEGASVRKKSLPDAEIVRRYLAGESELALARVYEVQRWTITRRLNEAGVQRRNRSQANRNRMSKLTSAERTELTKAAHSALRGQRYRRTSWRGKRVQEADDEG